VKVIVLFAVSFGAMFYVQKIGEQAVQSTGEQIQEVTTQALPLTSLAARMHAHQMEQMVQFERAVQYGATNLSEGAAQYRAAREAFSDASESVARDTARATALVDARIAALSTQPERQQYYTRIRTQLDAFAEAYAAINANMDTALRAQEAGESKKWQALTATIETQATTLGDASAALLGALESLTQSTLQRVESQEQQALRSIYDAGRIGLIAVGVIALLILIGTAVPLHRLKRALHTMANGQEAEVPHMHPHSEMGG
jgi:hypothetical protein